MYSLAGCNAKLDGYFECDNGICITSDLVCNGANNCLDYSDEKNCTCAVRSYSIWSCTSWTNKILLLLALLNKIYVSKLPLFLSRNLPSTRWWPRLCLSPQIDSMDTKWGCSCTIFFFPEFLLRKCRPTTSTPRFVSH